MLAEADLVVVIARLRAAGCVFAEDEAALLSDAAATPGELEAMVVQRVGGVPLEHILGWADFCGRRVAVDPGVFVPRRRTEFLVEQAVARTQRGSVVLDLCCGCGAVGLAVAEGLQGQVELHASDLDAAAVACARRNIAEVRGRAYLGDLFDPLPPALRGRVDTVVVNSPYVPTSAVAYLPPEARQFEPLIALDGGVDGLDVARRVAASAPAWLAAGGWLLIETSDEQAPVLAEVFAGHGLEPTVASGSRERDATVVLGKRSISD